MTVRRTIAVVISALAVGAGLVVGLLEWRAYRRQEHPLYLRGAIVRQNPDTQKQSPIAEVDVSTSDDVAAAPAKSDFAGGFTLRLNRGVKAGEAVTLHFRNSDYQPLDLETHITDTLYVVRMVPLHGEVEAELNPNATQVTNVLVRYSTESESNTSIGTDAATFQAVNRANVPCDRQSLCSPDGKWKAAVGSASLDAGVGDIFRNARVACIAGPCPFTRIDRDNFSRGGQKISVTARAWSDTATFLLQAEVFRTQVGDTVRESYPLIVGRTLDFTVPATAEGTTLEAEINGVETIFPLAPNPALSWADCSVRVDKNKSKDYRCELKAGYRFP